jgi:kynurenine 3-monooxygenase
MSQKKDIIVVGAGPVGCVLALYLAKRGHPVHVFERRADLRKDPKAAGRSINLALSVRGFLALDEVGAGEVIREEAIAMKGRMIHDVDGTQHLHPYGRDDQAIYSVSRVGLNRTLLEVAAAHPNISLSFSKRCIGADLDKPSASFVDEITRNTSMFSADFVFGTDGSASAVRNSMMDTRHFHCNQDLLSHGYKELCIPAATGGGGFDMEKHALHIWPRGKYMLIALPNPDGTFTCTLFLPQEGEPSFASLDSVAKARGFFAEVFADALARMPTFDADFQENPTSSLVTIRCGPWQQNQRVCLLGDAAHAVVPFYGQGLNAGFQDCTVLNNLLDESDGDWGLCLARFSDEHKKNGDAIADLALHNFIVMRDLVNDARFNLQKKIERQVHDWYPDYLPLYSMVSFSHTPYAKAVEYGKAQDRLMDGILELPDIEQRWTEPEVESVIRQKVEGFLKERKGSQAGE